MRQKLHALTIAAALVGAASTLAAEDSAATAPRGDQATTVSADRASTRADEALAQLTRGTPIRLTMTGNPQLVPEDTAPPETTFWDAVLRVFNRTGRDSEKPLHLQLFDQRSSFSWELAGQPYASGAFLLVADAVDHNANFDADPAMLDDLSIHVKIAPEPCIWPVQVAQYCIVDSAVDEKGLSLLPATPRSEVRVTFQQSAFMPVQPGVFVRLFRPDAAGRRIKHVKGRALVYVPDSPLRIEMPDAQHAKPESRETPAVALTVSTPTLSNNQVSVTLGFKRKKLSDSEWTQMVELAKASRLTVVDGAGNHLKSPGFGSGGDSKTFNLYGRLSVTGVGNQIEPVVGPLKLIVEFAPSLKEVQVPFEFRDLPLP
jgi:hypothetical protein